MEWLFPDDLYDAAYLLVIVNNDDNNNNSLVRKAFTNKDCIPCVKSFISLTAFTCIECISFIAFPLRKGGIPLFIIS